jgi:hypothetical protein
MLCVEDSNHLTFGKGKTIEIIEFRGQEKMKRWSTGDF